MRKYLLFCSIIIIICFSSVFIYFNIVINSNRNRNNKVVDIFNDVWENTIDVSFDEINLPKMEIDGVDYIGVIKIENYDFILPIEYKCRRFGSTCKYSSKPFIILGSNLKSSFYNYKLYSVGDIIIFMNTLGDQFRYRIKAIHRKKELEDVSFSEDDLIFVIKNYYSMEYIFFRCKREC